MAEVENIDKSLTNSSLYYCITNFFCRSNGECKVNVEIFPQSSTTSIMHSHIHKVIILHQRPAKEKNLAFFTLFRHEI